MTRPLATLALVAAAAGTVAVSVQAVAQGVVSVSQKNRGFLPRDITLGRGDSVLFVNDDGELLHHVHSTDAGAAFDTGELAPGTRTPIRFTRSGTFAVRCLIHPRMLLTVTVR